MIKHHYLKWIIIMLIIMLIAILANMKEINNIIKNRITLDELNDLKERMSVQEVIEKLGEPVDYVGSGFVIMRYNLEDGSSAFINLGGGNELMSVWIEYANGEEKYIIE